MASSVSSERAFSAAGITISKRWNRLKGDIVEALQCLKCMYHNEIIFRDVPVFEEVEAELDCMVALDLEEQDFIETVKEAECFSWDQLIAGNDENDDKNLDKDSFDI